MRMTPLTPRWLVLLPALTLLVAGSATPAPAQDADTASPSLLQHAKAGQFDKILERLDQSIDGEGSPRLRSFLDDLKRFKANKAERMDSQRSAYKDARERIEENLAEDDLVAALVGAIEARQVAPERWQQLSEADKHTRQAIERSEQAARDAMGQERWVEALNYYQLLNSLFDKRDAYREPLDRVRRHIRVLQLYAPEALRDLRDAYTERNEDDDEKSDGDGEDDETQADGGPGIDDEPTTDIDFTDWQKRLKGVQPTMLRQAARYAAREHVSGQGYDKLLKGAVHGLEVLIDTDQLTRTFPSLKNIADRNRFRDHLSDVRDRLDSSDDMQDRDAASVIDGILNINRQTIDLPDRVIVFEMSDGLASQLDDFSAIIWPEDLEQFNRSIEGDFTGVGIQITRRDGNLVVVTPLPDTPAYNAGIRAGDVIKEVNGEDASRWSLNRAVREITGPAGSEVTLGVQRDSKQDLLRFAIERAEIEIETVRGWRQTQNNAWDYWIDKPSGIGYIRLSQFMKQTDKELDKAVSQLQNQQTIDGLILDLRYNPGGLLSAAEKVADRFIDQGSIVSTVDAEGNRNTQHRATQRDTYPDFPVVVLINEGSASASEIVAGALQDYDRAFVVGSRTFGKGSVQDVYPLVRRKAYLKLTTQYYMLPDGRIIHRKPGDETWGIEPDLSIPMTSEQRYEAQETRQKADVVEQADADRPAQTQPVEASQLLEEGIDPQLEAALLYLKTRLIADDVAIAQRPGNDATKQ